MLGIRV